MQTGTLRILCISPHFPPMADPEGFCGAKMIMALAELGCDVTVLRMDLSLQPQKAVDESPLWRAAVETSLGVRPRQGVTRARSILSALRYQTESHSRWVDAVVREALSQHRAKPFDLVYSRSLPMVAHIAGYWCAKALHRPWVAGVNDPWDAHLFPGADPRCCSRIHAAMSRYWLRTTVTSATLVAYPSDRLRDFHVRLAGRPHRSVIVPHIGYACDSVPQSEPFFHLLHAGLIGRAHRRSATGLLKGLKQFLLRTPGAAPRR